jgi:TolA-binding protein
MNDHISSKALEMELFWQKHKRRLLSGGIILGILAIGAILFFVREHYLHQASKDAFSRAYSAEQLQAVISQYPASYAAANALLLLATEQRNLGKLEESDATYQKFLKEFPHHPLASGAALGIAENTLAAGRLEEGMTGLETFAAQYPTSYAAPFALYTKANLLAHQAGQTSEAKKELRNLNKQFPDSICARYSVNLLNLLSDYRDESAN